MQNRWIIQPHGLVKTLLLIQRCIRYLARGPYGYECQQHVEQRSCFEAAIFWRSFKVSGDSAGPLVVETINASAIGFAYLARITPLDGDDAEMRVVPVTAERPRIRVIITAAWVWDQKIDV